MITVGMLAKIRRMHLRDRLSIREVARRTGLSRNTVREWLRKPQVVEPCYMPSSAEIVSNWTRTGRC